MAKIRAQVARELLEAYHSCGNEESAQEATTNKETPHSDACNVEEEGEGEEEDCGMREVASVMIAEEEDAFDAIPNELLSEILLLHLPPIWQVVCRSVCQRWHLLLERHLAPALKLAGYAVNLARGGHLKVLQWARSQGCPWDENVCTYAARGGHLEVIQWARSQGCYWNENTCSEAAFGGHLEVLQWARSQHCLWNARTCERAAEGGHLEVLQWARSHGCPWNERACAYAAREGHLEVLQWARRRQDCHWDAWTCTYAAWGGHLKVLQWARSQGCPWNEDTCAYAACGGHLKVLQWARSQGCPWDELTCSYAAGQGHLEVLQWARSQGCPWDGRAWGGAHADYFEMLHWPRVKAVPILDPSLWV